MKVFGIAALLLASIATVHATPANVEVIHPLDKTWYFSPINVSVTANGAYISGRANNNAYLPRPSGHIDIAAFSPDGKLLAETTARYFPSVFNIHAQRRGGVRFGADLPGHFPTGSVFKIAFHPDVPTDDKPWHAQTVAQ